MGNPVGAAAVAGVIPAWKMQAAYEVQQALVAPGTPEQKHQEILEIVKNNPEMLAAYKKFLQMEKFMAEKQALFAKRAQEAKQMRDQPGPSTRR
ncbi:unnamed protein product [Ceutorhynchus assimilis]|uniref:Uncharacterized protein n=1 Tax=Ceutorhynchus assimilis TaxID=467358 RepID=A0A9N9QI70_9CUCU|nr:unnamed protein product [Ceutorhynchus assimilis]